MDFLIFHPFSLLEPKVIIFFNLGLKSIIASHYALKIDHFGFLQTSKILKNAWEIAFWSFLIFLKLALIFDFSQFQGICTCFKLLWKWIFFILSYFQGRCDTVFFTLFITQGWCVLWSYYSRNFGLILKVAQIAWFVSSTIVPQMTSLTLVTTVLFLYFVMVGLSFQYCKL